MAESILVVDDDDMQLDCVTQQIIQLGHAAHGAQSGAEALRFLESHRVGMVITDYRMDTIDGVQLRDLIRTKNEKIPIILMTGDGDPSLRNGFDGFLKKPFSMKDLRKEVERVWSAIAISGLN